MTLDASPLSMDRAPDLVPDKLWREVDVFFGGIVPGFRDAVTSHPGHSLANLGISTGIGMVATVATEVSKAAMPRLLNRVVAVSALISYAKDLAPSIDTTIDAFQRTWHSGRNVTEDKAVIGNSIGKFLFDTTISSAGGIAGAKFGRNKLFHEAMLTPVVKDVPIPVWAQIRRAEIGSERLESGLGNLAEVIKTPREPVNRIGASLEEVEKAGSEEAMAPKDVKQVTTAPLPRRSESTVADLRNGQLDLGKIDMEPFRI